MHGAPLIAVCFPDLSISNLVVVARREGGARSGEGGAVGGVGAGGVAGRGQRLYRCPRPVHGLCPRSAEGRPSTGPAGAGRSELSPEFANPLPVIRYRKKAIGKATGLGGG